MGEGLVAAAVAAKGLKVGDRLLDNDPRSTGRWVEIEGFKGVGQVVFAECRSMVGARVTVRLDRIHVDGRVRRSGFSLGRK